MHDCYGVSPKDVDLLVSILRGVYIELYSNNKYIETFDKDIIQTLQQALSNKHPESKIKYDSEKRLIYTDDTELIKLPPLPCNKELLNKVRDDYFTKLKKSILLIN